MSDDGPNLEDRLERLDERIETLKALSSETGMGKKHPEAPSMSCPQCGSPMRPGRVALHGDLGTWLMFGFGLEHGWFQPGNDEPEERVLHSTKPRRAHLCSQCKTVVIMGDDPVS
jgi:hypothetical protein